MKTVTVKWEMTQYVGEKEINVLDMVKTEEEWNKLDEDEKKELIDIALEEWDEKPFPECRAFEE